MIGPVSGITDGNGYDPLMDRDAISQICAVLPGATYAHPADGELDSWKVGGKMFACFAASKNGVCVKTADIESAQLLIELGRAERARYFHKSWVMLPWEHADRDEVEARLTTSYDLIFAKLPKKLRDSLS